MAHLRLSAGALAFTRQAGRLRSQQGALRLVGSVVGWRVGGSAGALGGVGGWLRHLRLSAGALAFARQARRLRSQQGALRLVGAVVGWHVGGSAGALGGVGGWLAHLRLSAGALTFYAASETLALPGRSRSQAALPGLLVVVHFAAAEVFVGVRVGYEEAFVISGEVERGGGGAEGIFAYPG